MVERCIYICIYLFIYFINYIENYMFRRLIIAIFKLYMNHLVSSYTNTHTHTHIWATYMVKEVKWARDLVSVRTVGTCGMHGGFMLF